MDSKFSYSHLGAKSSATEPAHTETQRIAINYCSFAELNNGNSVNYASSLETRLDREDNCISVFWAIW